MQNIQGGMNQSNQPLFGNAQIGSYAGSLNELANSSISSLKQILSRSGALNSGRLASGATDINMNKMGNLSNFMANVPMMNRQAQLQGAGLYGGLANSLMGVAPRTSYGSNTSNNQSSTTYNPSIMSDIGQGVGIAGGIMGMPSLSGFMGGGGGAPPNFDPSTLFQPQGGPPGGPNVSGAGWGGAPGGGVPWWLPQQNLPGFGG